MATYNHIHLLIRDSGSKDTIAKPIQLIAARTKQEFDQRKKRKGAFGVDRYHPTAVETGAHSIQCLVFIDLNMVRAEVASHPSEWNFSGYNEILLPESAVCADRL
jgi:putative transposase